MNIWRILGIDPTTDIKEIKSAYARLSKTVHPEDNPEKFKVLYNAYKKACTLAKQKSVNINNNDVFDKDTFTINGESSSKDNEIILEYDFNAVISEYDCHCNEQLDKRIDEIFDRDLGFIYNSFITSVIFRNRCWGNFFADDEVRSLAHNPVFIDKLCDYIKSHKQKLKFLEYIYWYYQFCELENTEDKGIYSELYDLSKHGVEKLEPINKIKQFFGK